jgi:hypothetical protein
VIPEVEEDILDVVNKSPGISTRKVSMQVGVTLSTVWRVLLQQQQLCPYHLQLVQDFSLQDYSARVMFASGSYKSGVQILNRFHYLTMKNSLPKLNRVFF